MLAARTPLLAALALTLGSAVAQQTVTLGSPLTQAPNTSRDCSEMPALLPDGSFGLSQSGVADCTWAAVGDIR